MSGERKFNFAETLATGLVDARRMFICLACFQIEAWQAVAACTLTCWKTNPKDPTLIAVLFLAGGMILADPPWHAIAFEAAHRLTTTAGNRIMLVASGVLIAILSGFHASVAPAIVGGVGAATSLYTSTRRMLTKEELLSPKESHESTNALGGALVAIAWALAVHAEVDHIRWFAPIMLLADYKVMGGLKVWQLLSERFSPLSKQKTSVKIQG